MESLTYTAHIEPAKDGGFIASVPALPGCFSQGQTEEETITKVRNAIERYLALRRSEGLSNPPDTIFFQVTVNVPKI